jgi:hypothetical protein
LRRVGLTLILVVGTIVAGAAPAKACSCALGDPREGLEMSDGAFVGTLLSRTGGPHDSTNTLRFQVEIAVKGELGSEVDVLTSANGASCGLEVAPGERVGLFLGRGDDGPTWWSSMCSRVDPDELLAAAQPLPAPDGSGPVRYLVGGAFGDARVVALDESGRTLGYGLGQGSTYRLSVCPGFRRFVELVSMSARTDFVVAVRDTATLAVIRQVEVPGGVLDVPGSPGINVDDLSCRDEDADEVLLLVDEWPEGSGRTHVLRVSGTSVEDAFAARGQYGFFDGDRALLYRGRNPADIDELAALDLQTGDEVVIANLPAGTWQAAPNPGDTHVAGVMPSESAATQVFLTDLTVDPPVTITASLGAISQYGQMVWLDGETVAFFPWGNGDGDDAIVYDSDLQQVTSFGPWGGRPTLEDGVAYGLLDDAVRRAPLPDGPVETVRVLDLGDSHGVVPVGGEIHVIGAAPAPRGVPPAPPQVPAAQLTPEHGASASWPLWAALGLVSALAVVALVIRRRLPSFGGTGS